jgi:hypothetical protein
MKYAQLLVLGLATLLGASSLMTAVVAAPVDSTPDAFTSTYHTPAGHCRSSSPPFPGAVCEHFTTPEGRNEAIYIHKNAVHPNLSSSMSFSPNTLELPTARVKWVPGEGENRDWCNLSTSIRKTNSASPWANDCLLIQVYLAANPGHFIVMPQDLEQQTYTPLLTAGSSRCSLGIGVREKDMPLWGVAVGNMDAGDVIWDAVGAFLEEGRVGALGQMACLAWVNDGSYHKQIVTYWNLATLEQLNS